MNDRSIGSTAAVEVTEPATDWARLREMDDADIAADPDAALTDEAFWASAKVVLPARKQTVTLRLDADVLAWFRRERGYQTKINAILRSYMGAKQGSEPA